MVGTEYIVGGPYPELDDTKSTAEDEVVGVDIIKLGSEEFVAENDIELMVAWDDLFTSGTFVGALSLADDAFMKHKQALDSREAGITEIELGKVCLVPEISWQRRLATRG